MKAMCLTLCSSRFVFVPGPEDPGPGSVLPRSVCFTFYILKI